MSESEKPRRKRRLVFVGGGPATLAAVYHLTRNEPEFYQITIYEMSWRLGGKTASGRDAQGRIEEHGLHILFGSYHNVFRTMIDCYRELRDKQLVSTQSHWLQDFADAIEPHHYGVIGDDRGKRWERFDVSFPSNRGVPGELPLPSLWDLAVVLCQLAWMIVLGPWSLRHLQRCLAWPLGYRKKWRSEDFPRDVWGATDASGAHALGGSVLSRLALKAAIRLLDGGSSIGKLLCTALGLGQRLWRVAWRPFGPGRVRSSVDFFFAMALGLIRDRVLHRPGGFEAIDSDDFRVWLKKHGASDGTLGSPWIRALYDAAFSYPRGGVHRGHPAVPEPWPPGLPEKGFYENIAAGVAARAFLTTFLTYKGCFYNKMVAGMGDVISTPLYLVLKARGVRFEFFHRLADVKAIRDESGAFVVDELIFDTLPEPVPEYDPLIPVAGLLCWPSSPKLAALPRRAHQRALEAESCAPSDAPRSIKVVCRDEFDAVVLGVPVAALPYACSSLFELDRGREDLSSKRLSAQPDLIETVRTIALQLWFKPDLTKLGWPRPSPLLSLFHDPINTWCDMTHLLPREPWPTGRQPGNISYFCGPFPHDTPFPAPGALTSHAALAFHGELDKACEVAVDAFSIRLPELLPGTTDADGFNFSLLFDPSNGARRDRLRAQYRRINGEPQQTCTLALSGASDCRLSAEATGYDNLYITGDWIANGVYIACVEGAFQAGIRTARAVSARLGAAPHRYVILAEELLNLQVISPMPKRGAPRQADATSASGEHAPSWPEQNPEAVASTPDPSARARNHGDEAQNGQVPSSERHLPQA
jgi:uncharacterized protein with NAD-binding domain and iron-sulfur cluster